MAVRQELLSWHDIDALIDHLVPQFEGTFDGMVLITRGGLVPGGILAEVLDLTHVLTAAVDFPTPGEGEDESKSTRLLAWPKFLQFPDGALVRDRRLLVVDDVWGSGRTITAVKNGISAAGGEPYTCVLHFNPYRNLFGSLRPDYYAAITDAHIVYPWEGRRGPHAVLARPSL
jgi:hypoxanthine phosphoribosyltransferase